MGKANPDGFTLPWTPAELSLPPLCVGELQETKLIQ